MRICFTSDLHGNDELYAQLGGLLRVQRPDVLILGGDLFVDGDLVDPLDTQVRYVTESFMPRIAQWRAELPGMRTACILGNHDWLCTLLELTERQKRGEIVVLDSTLEWRVGDVGFLGYSYTPPSPYWVKDFERRDRLQDGIPDMGGAVWDPRRRDVRKADADHHFIENPTIEEDLAAAPTCHGKWIFVAHAPPYDTPLDRLPHLAYPIGSRAVRAFIEEREPLVSLHGHIHESPDVTGAYSTTLGRTLSINPGQSQSRLHAVMFDTDAPAQTLRRAGALVSEATPARDDSLKRTIVLIGYRGSGKTVVGRQLARRLGWEHVDLDTEIETRAGLTIRQIFERHGEPFFRTLETSLLADRLDRCSSTDAPPIVLSVGGGAVLEPASRKLIRRAGRCVWLVAPVEELACRIGDDPQSSEDRPALTSLDARDEIETVLRERTPLYEQTAHWRVDTAGRSVEQVVDAVMAALTGIPADVHGSTA